MPCTATFEVNGNRDLNAPPNITRIRPYIPSNRHRSRLRAARCAFLTLTEIQLLPPSDSVLTTIYKFPTMEPLRFESYASKHLHLPLRRDILHRAVIFEGDFTRQGTASTKTRWEIHGSHKKIRPQKGM